MIVYESDTADAGNAGMYVHVPFCIRKCRYCDFFSSSDLSLIPAYVNAVIKELKMAAPKTSCVFDTLYIGGGTPSVLKPDEIGRLLGAVMNSFKFSADPEITIEVNPGTAGFDQFSRYRRLGINRLSMGIQSFNDDNLTFLGRIHSAEDARRAWKDARKAGFFNMSLDLIYGLPGQTPDMLREDLESAVMLNPEHLSCYLLTYEAGTPLERSLMNHEFAALGDEQAAKMFDQTRSFLKENGYLHYEVSNFARSDSLVSRHNCKYWSDSPYTGFGPSAHSYAPDRRKRFWNVAGITSYIDLTEAGKLPVDGEEHLTEEQQMIESVYLGLRTEKGIRLKDFEKRFNRNFTGTFGRTLKSLISGGDIEMTEESCRLTFKGMAFLDAVTSRLVSEI